MIVRTHYPSPECDCDPSGSQTSQCDRKTGACKCLPGIGGHQCNVCDRGYLGTAPVCIPCGECFDNWDRTLQEYRSIISIDVVIMLFYNVSSRFDSDRIGTS